jgi:hypothetical protein
MDLALRIARLLEDLGGLSAAAVIGFAGDPTAEVAELSRDARWAFVDARDGKAALPTGAIVVALVRAAAVPSGLDDRVTALLDKRGTGKLIVLCEGAEVFAKLPKGLQRIPYSDFVRAA